MIPVRSSLERNRITINDGEEMETKECFSTIGGQANQGSHFRNQLKSFQKSKKELILTKLFHF